MNDMTMPLITNELDFLETLVPLADARVIEAGCGAAHLARELVGRHDKAEVVGIEVDERVAAKHPFKQEPFTSRDAVLPDGTVVDW